MLFRLPSEEELTDNKLNEFIAKHNAECAFRFKHLKDAYETDYQIFHQKPKPDYKPDNRIAVNFAKYMVDTFNGYFIGNPIKISVDGDAADNIKNMWSSWINTMIRTITMRSCRRSVAFMARDTRCITWMNWEISGLHI